MDGKFDFMSMARDRIARQCVCCGSENLARLPAILMPFVAYRAFGWLPQKIDETWGLRTIESGHAYPLCNSLRCGDCGLLFLDIRFSDRELASLYDDYRKESYNNMREHFEPGYLERARQLSIPISYRPKVEEFLKPYIKRPLSILDWGGDTGINTPFNDQADIFDIYDISGAAPTNARARCVNKSEAHADTYSLLICSHVLEHTPYPSDILNDIKPAMGKESILYIEVPLEPVMRDDERNALERKRYWHEHVNYYSKESLIKLIKNVGMTPLAVGEIPYSDASEKPDVYQVICKLNDEAELESDSQRI